ncbi:MAG: isocitrate/isopropylmalate dehydrogenase family protein [Methanobacteriota archaeon]
MRVAVLPGDGIGPEVMEACLAVLGELDAELAFESADIGLSSKAKHGEYLTGDALDLVKSSDAALMGAITTPKDTRGYVSPLLLMRWELELYANLRPARCLMPSLCVHPMDVTIVRENTEGMYAGIERAEEGRVVLERVVSEKACKRIIDFAFKYAIDNARSKVTCVHKANVMTVSDGMFRNIFYGSAVNYAFYNKIRSDDMHVDAAAMWLAKDPTKFDVIVTLNLYGDILSDEAAGLTGGLGFAPSGNIGDKHALFEPVHGSAPDIAGKGIANPAAMILSAAMMLRHLGMAAKAKALEGAVVRALESGALTPDVGGTTTTSGFAEAVAKALKE